MNPNEQPIMEQPPAVDEAIRQKMLEDIKFGEEVQKVVATESAENASIQTLPELSPEAIEKIQNQEEKKARHDADVTKAFESLQSAAVRYGSENQEKLEVTFDQETLSAKSFEDAKEICEKKGGRLPTKAELLYAYNNKIAGFDDKTYWSSDEGLDNDAYVVNFKTGSEGLVDKSMGIYVARATDIKH